MRMRVRVCVYSKGLKDRFVNGFTYDTSFIVYILRHVIHRTGNANVSTDPFRQGTLPSDPFHI